MNQFRTFCLTSSSEANRLSLRAFFMEPKNGVIAWREVWTVWRVTALDDWRMLLLAFTHVACTRDPLAAGSERPRSCRNHTLLHTQRYCHRFAHSRLRLVYFWTHLIAIVSGNNNRWHRNKKKRRCSLTFAVIVTLLIELNCIKCCEYLYTAGENATPSKTVHYIANSCGS